MSSKDHFLSRIDAFQLASRSSAIIPLSPVEVDHNKSAKLLRNGLAIVGFASLEGFIKLRTAETLTRIDGETPTPFTSLPDKLKTAASFGAVKALNHQIKRISQRDPSSIQYICEHAKAIASLNTDSYQLPQLSMLNETSNLSDDSVKEALNAFQVLDPWQQMTNIASRCGLGMPDLRQSFQNAASRRHEAAHEPETNTPLSDLQNYAGEAIAIGMSYDILITECRRRIARASASYLNGDKIESGAVNIRFLDEVGSGEWGERREGASRFFKKYSTFEEAKLTALPRCQKAERY